ncbi:glycosyltransferase [Glycomyces sp. NPDC048151]|uniref:glycosyltransferase n=1 Tax=Glycomyces sp. NPDC048151 TaxID=3364002 RepID=UPI00371CB8FE
MNKHTRLRAVLTCGAAAATIALPFVLDAPYALAAGGLVLAVLIGLTWRASVRLRRLGRDIAAGRQAAALLRAHRAPDAGNRRKRRVFEALEGGFPVSAVREAREFAADTRVPLAERIALLREVEARQLEEERSRVAPERFAVDVVYVADCGGDVASVVAEVEICRDLGLTVGLLHHPVYRRQANAPLDPRVEALLGGPVRLIGRDDEVACALAVVRNPVPLMHPLERRPLVAAARTAVVAAEPPSGAYGAGGEAWEVAIVARNVTGWLGAHTWYAGGPLVQAALERHPDVDLAPEPWHEVVDLGHWRREGRRVPDGRIRIGRHSRDERSHWPERRETLLECYPEREPFEVHVLGGVETPARVLGGLPRNWTVHPFDAMPTVEFLAEIDVMVCFAGEGMGAFGRAPLEAMAAGVPVVMDRRFAPVYGPAALYCEPGEVALLVERLATEPGAYAAQQEAAWAHLADHCSAKSLMDRLPVVAAA